jgi:hypothetical protein
MSSSSARVIINLNELSLHMHYLLKLGSFTAIVPVKVKVSTGQHFYKLTLKIEGLLVYLIPLGPLMCHVLAQ